MKRFIFISILVALFSTLQISAAIKTPTLYQDVEKELKKQYKKVVFFDKCFFVKKNVKGEYWAAATLEGKVFTPFSYASDPTSCNAFEIKTLGGKKYLLSRSSEDEISPAIATKWREMEL